MTATEFDALLERRLALCRRVLGQKAGEYATEADRLHNFKRAAELRNARDGLGPSPPESLMGMLVKHWVSIEDVVQLASVGVRPARALVDEKIGDAINYLILLEAVLTEETARGV